MTHHEGVVQNCLVIFLQLQFVVEVKRRELTTTTTAIFPYLFIGRCSSESFLSSFSISIIPDSAFLVLGLPSKVKIETSQKITPES